jgi:hypothetical protein
MVAASARIIALVSNAKVMWYNVALMTAAIIPVQVLQQHHIIISPLSPNNHTIHQNEDLCYHPCFHRSCCICVLPFSHEDVSCKCFLLQVDLDRVDINLQLRVHVMMLIDALLH